LTERCHKKEEEEKKKKIEIEEDGELDLEGFSAQVQVDALLKKRLLQKFHFFLLSLSQSSKWLTLPQLQNEGGSRHTTTVS